MGGRSENNSAVKFAAAQGTPESSQPLWRPAESSAAPAEFKRERVLRASHRNCSGAGQGRRSELGRKLLCPFCTHAQVQFFARSRNRWERLLSIEWYARVDDDARIALVVLRVVAHRIER